MSSARSSSSTATPSDDHSTPDTPKGATPSITLDQARAFLGMYRLVCLYQNRSTRYQFRDAAKEAGFDVGKPDERNPALYEVGELEAALQDLPPIGRS